jgi:hypothetical protein
VTPNEPETLRCVVLRGVMPVTVGVLNRADQAAPSPAFWLPGVQGVTPQGGGSLSVDLFAHGSPVVTALGHCAQVARVMATRSQRP